MGAYGRFRPTYYLFREIETIFWGTNAEQWYAVRLLLLLSTAVLILLFTVSLGTIFKLTTNFSSKYLWVAGFPALGIIFLPAWKDIVYRLGPSEIYYAPLISLFLVLFTLVVKVPSSRVLWGVTALTTVLLVGTKENGVIFSALFIALYFVTRKGHQNRSPFIFSLIVFIYSIFVALGPLLAMVRGGGGDIYGQTRSIKTFLLMSTSSEYVLTALLLSVIVFVCEFTSGYLQNNNEFSSLGVSRTTYLIQKYPLSLSMLAGIALLLFELYVYQNYYDIGRYGLGSQLYLVVMTVIVLVSMFRFSLDVMSNSWVALFLAAFLLWGTGYVNSGLTAFSQLPRVGESASAATMQTQEDLQSLAEKSELEEQLTFRIVINGPGDYEPALSLGPYLYYLSGNSNIQLEIPEGIAVEGLVKGLAGMSEMGVEDYSIAPHSPSSNDSKTICLFVSTPTHYEWCDESIQVRWGLPQ